MTDEPQQKKMTRRRALALATAGGVAIGAGALAAVRIRDALREGPAPPEPRTVAERIRAELSYLDLDPNAPDEFATDYYEYAGDDERARIDPELVSRFLLSTDFFDNGADESKRVSYVLFYDPYVNPCRNPLGSAPP